MTPLQDVKEVPYPPPPWKCSGQMWTGVFKSTVSRGLPAGFKHVLDPHLFIISLIRYLDGTLRYDELIFGTLAMRGIRYGIHVDEIWVDDPASIWGGRRIWGLPKNPATFHWNDGSVQITDSHGLIAAVSVDAASARSPWIWLPSPGFGWLNDSWVYYIGSLWARPGKTNMQITQWPERYAPLQSSVPLASFGGKPFEMSVPPPKVLRA
jgi:hypothetical protein